MIDWDASDYNRISTLQRVLAEEHLALVKLKSNERVLDIGCGDGKVTAALARRVPHGSVLGIDPSPRMIDFARTQFPTEAGQPIRFEVGDARTLAFQNAFDMVVSFNALHWVREHGRVLEGIRHALTAGGRAILEFVPGGDPDSVECAIENVRQEPRWAPHFRGFDNPFHHFLPEQYRKLANEAGLVVNRLLVEHGLWEFGSREAFAGFVHGTLVAWVQRVPDAEQPAFIGDVLHRYDATGGSKFRYLQMVVDLRKRGGATQGIAAPSI